MTTATTAVDAYDNGYYCSGRICHLVTLEFNQPTTCSRTVVYEDGVAVGVEAEGVVCKAKCVIGDPSYFQDK
eukprot:3802534-Pyramimonas_sp.AAC.1